MLFDVGKISADLANGVVVPASYWALRTSKAATVTPITRRAVEAMRVTLTIWGGGSGAVGSVIILTGMIDLVSGEGGGTRTLQAPHWALFCWGSLSRGAIGPPVKPQPCLLV